MSSNRDANKIIELDDLTFEKLIIQRQGLVLIDFGAPWCSPCIALIPILQELSEAFDDHLIVGSVNVDKHPVLAQKFDIKTLPTVILFKDGKIIEIFYGKQQLHIYADSILRALGAGSL